MFDNTRTMSGFMQGNLDDPRFKLAKSESEYLLERCKEGNLHLPCIRTFDKEDNLTAEIKLRPHTDEASYRDALMEVAIVLPSLNSHSCSLLFRTQPEGYGLTVITSSLACSIFFDRAGDKITAEDGIENSDNIDSETVMVLDRFVGKNLDASFVNENLTVLGRHGHEIELFQDPDTFWKSVIF